MLFNEYLQGIAKGSDWSDTPGRMHRVSQQAKEEADSKRKTRGRKEEQKDLVHDILQHHTSLPLDRHSHEQVIDVGT